MTSFVVAVAVFLALFNNLTNAWELPRWTYVPLNLAVAAVLIAVARRQGLSWDDLGMGRGGWWPGLRVGVAVAVVIGVGLAIAFVVPGAERFLSDNRVAALSASGLWYTAAVRIPLGTVVLEEVAFRGVLFGAWSRVASAGVAAVGSCAIFGLWHIVPMLEMLRTNAYAGSDIAKWGFVGLGVVGTALGGGVLLAVRMRTGSVAGPLVIHAAANSLATIAAYAWQRR